MSGERSLCMLRDKERDVDYYNRNILRIVVIL
jgi:hypothetical protein